METLRNPETEQIQLIEDIFRRPIVIGLEGGPRGGKSTLVERLSFMESDRPIVALPEIATQLAEQYFKNGVDIMAKIKTDSAERFSFQKTILRLTVEAIEKACQEYYGTGAVIVADRVDISAYISPEEYQRILQELGYKVPPFLSHVDKILYFPTQARTNPEAYNQYRLDNPFRSECAIEAVEACRRNLHAVKEHPELHYIDLGNFSDSIDAAAEYVLHPDEEHEIGGFLAANSPEPWSLIARKLHEKQYFYRSHLYQSYHQVGDLEYRLRGESGTYFANSIRYTVSLKDKNSNLERQRIISHEEYQVLYKNAEASLNKTRHRFLHKDEQTGSTDVWCLDLVETEPGKKLWIFEVEKHNQVALAQIKPPFEIYRPKDIDCRELARLSITYC